jgi:CheY-like chemotaxis protein
MIERTEFDRQVRDGLASLYDYAALETHPLASIFPKPPDQPESQADYLRSLLLGAIERLRPPGRERSAEYVEWRPFLILHGRYVKGTSLQELQARLSLSARQLRREHGRALRAVAALLWDQACLERGEAAGEEEERAGPGQQGNSFQAFDFAPQPLDLAQVVRGVASVLQRRVRNEDAELHLVLSEELPYVQADRVILRQILFSLINHALHVRTDGDIVISAEAHADQVDVWIQFQADDPSSTVAEDEETPLETARYWIQRLGAALQALPSGEQASSARFILSLPRADQAVVLVVDDQEPAIRMFQRYLSRSNVQVVGVRDPERVLPLARELQPQAITLDVMMPTVDGWEILQSLCTDPETQHIPIVVCSVWDEPELASSLGAAEFLKKPVVQRDLLTALARLKLVDTPD